MNGKSVKSREEWFKQAQYDIGTAEVMLKSGRYIYVVFFCHLALEKALKGLYAGIAGKEPPKIHNLRFFVEKTGIELEEDMTEFIIKLNVVSVPTRYPSDLSKMSSDYNKAKTGEILQMTKEVEKCLRTK